MLSEELCDRIDYVLGTLSPKEEKIIRKHCMNNESVKDIAIEFGVSQTRIRQIEKKALRKLKHPSRVKLLKRGFI